MCKMDRLDELLPGPEVIKSERLSGPILDSAPLLGTDIWREATDLFDGYPETQAKAGLPLEQQQYLNDLRVDHHLYDTLEDELGLLDSWLKNHIEDPEAIQVASLVKRRFELGARSWIDQQEELYLWANRNEQADLAASILGWRLLCQELAESLLGWSLQRDDDPRARQIRLWQDSPGFYSQNRLRIWALRFLEDARAPQVLAWERAIRREIAKADPRLPS
jgi:hypothetical protein